MLRLATAIVFGLGVTLFALHNSILVPIGIGGLSISGVPLYLVVVLSLLTGVLASFIFSLISGRDSSPAGQKEKVLKDARDKIANLNKKVSDLEAENSRFRLKLEGRDTYITANKQEYNDVLHKPSIFDHIFPDSKKRYSKNF